MMETTVLSEPVVLDNNIQTYDFYKPDGSKLGVSFNTIRDINTPLNAVDPLVVPDMNNTFNIDKKIELVDKKNNQVLDRDNRNGWYTSWGFNTYW